MRLDLANPVALAEKTEWLNSMPSTKSSSGSATSWPPEAMFWRRLGAWADFYDVGGECRFGELTLYPECGVDCRFKPDEWNAVIGGWLELPEPVRNPKFAFGPGIGLRSSN